MRKFASALICLSLALGAQAQNSKATPEKGLEQMSALRTILEYFYMETGAYPLTLEELNVAYNAELPLDVAPVQIPKDPATGREFVYKAERGRAGYYLSFPDPTRYGFDAGFHLKPMNWGWLAYKAQQNRFEKMVGVTRMHVQGIAASVERYAKDNEGKYPDSMDALFPKYIRRHPQDPVTGKNYGYQKREGGFVVYSPNPQAYGFKKFQYSSSEGLQVEVMETPKLKAPKPKS